MQIKRIKTQQWYQTKQGEGKCLSTAGKHPKFLIDGKEVWLSSSDVQHEIAEGQEPQEKAEAPPRSLPGRPPQEGGASTKKQSTDEARIAELHRLRASNARMFETLEEIAKIARMSHEDDNAAEMHAKMTRILAQANESIAKEKGN